MKKEIFFGHILTEALIMMMEEGLENVLFTTDVSPDGGLTSAWGRIKAER